MMYDLLAVALFVSVAVIGSQLDPYADGDRLVMWTVILSATLLIGPWTRWFACALWMYVISGCMWDWYAARRQHKTDQQTNIRLMQSAMWKSYRTLRRQGVPGSNIGYVCRNYVDDGGRRMTPGALFDTSKAFLECIDPVKDVEIVCYNRDGSVQPTYRCYCVDLTDPIISDIIETELETGTRTYNSQQAPDPLCQVTQQQQQAPVG
jgi:hypothetical protein